MRFVTFGAGGLLSLALLAGAGCATDDAQSCNHGDEAEAALDDLDQIIEDDTDANNLDERLENLGDDINKVMNTTDDENALQLRDLELKYADLKAQLERLGEAEGFSETGKELNRTLDQLGDAIHRMSDATEEDCTP